MRKPVVALVVALALAPVPAGADAGSFRDPDEQPFCESGGPCPDSDYMDFRRLTFGHGGQSGRLRHGIRTAERWKTKWLGGRNGVTIAIDFDTDGDRHAERSVKIRRKDGELVAGMFRGKYHRKRVDGHVRVWRPGRRSVKVAFSVDLLSGDVSEYRWRAHWWNRDTVCPGSCHTDFAPHRGWYEHDL